MTPPRAVRDLADRLRVSCRTTPLIEWDEARTHWRITVSNERVTMTLDYKVTSGGRWVWASSTLTIDGKPSHLAHDYEHFVRVWKNPDEIEHPEPVPSPVSTPIEVLPMESMPAGVVYALEKVSGKEGINASSVGFVDDNFWAAEFVFPRAVMRFHWSRQEGDDPELSSHLFLLIDGEDKTHLVQGRLDKALSMIAQIPHPGVADPASVAGSSGSQRDRGVEVRATHVMRT